MIDSGWSDGLGLETRGKTIVEKLGGTWRRGGGMCRCPAHDDRNPSLSVRVGERRLLFHCFAGCTPFAVIRALGERLLLDSGTPGGLPASTPADPGRRHRALAAILWSAARAIGGTPAEAYLWRRGLGIGVCDLRFHPRVPLGGRAEARFLPALLAAVRDESGLVAVHRTFLAADGSAVAAIERPKRALGSLGSLGEGAVRLQRPTETLGWAEGIESAMAATILTGIPCWATLGTARFGRIGLPPGVNRLVLFLDHDPAGRSAERLARLAPKLREVRIEARYPPRVGTDWNDLLVERSAAR